MFACTLCYLEKDNSYLMLHRVKKEQDINAGKWIGIGGHIEEGETPDDCVVREVKEETGLTLKSFRLRGIVDFINDQCENEIMYLYTSDDFSGEMTECDEGVLKWVPINEIESLPIWEGDAVFLKDLREKKDFFHLQLFYHGDKLISYRYLPRVILASASPRRQELLQQIGILPEIKPSNVDEYVNTDVPDEMVRELSLRKAKDIAEKYPDNDVVIIGSDTVVSIDGEILGKPKTHEDAREMIEKLQGKEHQVFTGVTLIRNIPESQDHPAETIINTFAECTYVKVYPMTGKEIKEYTDSEEPMDKAGAYGIQGPFAAYIESIRGDYSNVVGLPVGSVWQHLKRIM